MAKIITGENVRLFAYVNDAICVRPIKGIVVEFMGLGGQARYDEETERGQRMAAAGFLFVIPYLAPWSWMNETAVRTTDAIIEAVEERCGVTNLPVISTGGSMVGLAALTYTRYARRTPIACAANCPVCDLPYHYTERPDLPRTLVSAFGTLDTQELDAAMKANSPLHLALAGEMPDVSYTIFHCEQDQAVNKQKHSDRFVQAMEGRDVTYIAVPDRGHCDLPEDVRADYERRIMESVKA